MAHVKWLTQITVLTKPFSGYFQGEKYVLRYRDGTEKPVQEMQVKSSITSPTANDTLGCCKAYSIRGHAWSGRTNISKVEISVDGGNSWVKAQLTEPSSEYSWQQWNYSWTPCSPGRHTILARATNSDGIQQPSKSVWNELGYQVNGVKPITIHVAQQ
jgi:hypothetical protein